MSVSKKQARVIALSFPGGNEQLKHGGTVPHYFIGGRFFTWIREEENSLVVRIDSIDERDALIESDPALFHITDHYRNWPGILIRLNRATPRLIHGMLERRFRQIATRKLLAEWEGRQAAPSDGARSRRGSTKGDGNGQGSSKVKGQGERRRQDQ